MKEIPGLEGRYAATKEGEIYSFPRLRAGGKFLSKKLRSGYYAVTIYPPEGRRFRKNESVHVLVCLAYHPNPNSLPQVNHKDGNKLNNHIDNLEWVSISDNQRHRHEKLGHVAPNRRFTDDEVLLILSSSEENSVIAFRESVSVDCIWAIRRGKNYKKAWSKHNAALTDKKKGE